MKREVKALELERGGEGLQELKIAATRGGDNSVVR